MNQMELYRQIIDGCDEALRDAFLRRMEMSLKVAENKLGGNSPVYDGKREAQILDNIAEGLPPELALKARSLWRSLLRMSRGRQYHFFVSNDPNRKPSHEAFLLDERPLGAVLCSESDAERAAAALGRETVPCESAAHAISELEAGAQPWAAVVLDSFSNSDRLLTMIYDRPVYINDIVSLPDGKCVFLLSKSLINTPENNMVCIAFRLEVGENGALAQVLEVFSDLRINVEFLQLNALPGDDENIQQYVVFANVNGELTSTAMRSALLQLESERPFFRVIGYRPTLAWGAFGAVRE